MFLSRALYQTSECKRMLLGSKDVLTRAAPSVNFSVLDFAATADVEPLVKRRRLTSKTPCPDPRGTSGCGGPRPAAAAPPALDAPQRLPNIGNTCFMNSILQCCRQLLMRIPAHLLPESQQCPLARALQATSLSEDEILQLPCWTFLPVGPQRDACEVLEMCFDPAGPMHISCNSGECYGALLRNLTLFPIEHRLHCNHCAYTHEEMQSQCLLRVEPHVNAEASISLSLQERGLPDWKCDACGKVGGRKQSALGDLPPFLLAHINK